MTAGPDPRANFAVDLAEIEACARTSLPQVLDAVARSTARLGETGGALVRPGASSGAAGYAQVHQQVVEVLLGRQERGGRAIEGTISALAEIAAVYRRVDGG